MAKNETKSVEPAAEAAPRNVYDGLVRAQAAVQFAAKDARNEFHKYNYASAESMISACRAALSSAGIVARRRSWRISEDGLFVLSTFEVALGATGDTLTDADVPWAIIAEKGRPLDKALAGALTTSLSYWLRDLLLLPREEEADMDRRNDKANPTAHGVRAIRGGNAPDLNAAVRERAAAPKAAEPAGPTIEARGFLHDVSERSVNGHGVFVADIETGGEVRQFVVSPATASDVGLPAARADWVNEPIRFAYSERANRLPMISRLSHDETADAVAPDPKGGADGLF
jgi:hypothetical protein